MVADLVAFVQNFPVTWRVLVLAVLPVTELRLSIPLALVWGVPPGEAFGLSLLGNMLPVIPLLLLLSWFARLFACYPPAAHLLQRIFAYTRRRGGQVERYGILGLMLFVAIPAPGTGAWTGSLLAFLLGLNLKISFWAIFGGVVIAGFIVTLASLGVWQLFTYFYLWEALLILALVVFLFFFWRWWRQKNYGRF